MYFSFILNYGLPFHWPLQCTRLFHVICFVFDLLLLLYSFHFSQLTDIIFIDHRLSFKSWILTVWSLIYKFTRGISRTYFSIIILFFMFRKIWGFLQLLFVLYGLSLWIICVVLCVSLIFSRNFTTLLRMSTIVICTYLNW